MSDLDHAASCVGVYCDSRTGTPYECNCGAAMRELRAENDRYRSALATQNSEVYRLELDNALLRSVLTALVEALPKCDGNLGDCDAPATRTFGRGGVRYCDEHGSGDPECAESNDAPEYARTVPMRAAIALLETGEKR